MKRLVLMTLVAMCAGAAFAAVADRAPCASGITPASGSAPDAWGQMVRSFAVLPSSGTNSTGAVTTYDNYFLTGMWSAFNMFYVYTTAGSFVRSVTASSPSAGFRDGTGGCHLGNGYFVAGGGGPGLYGYYTYAAGGNPGSVAAGNLMSAGRGIGWNGTYYYAVTGNWSTAVAEYSTTGSQIRTIPYGTGVPIYGVAAHPSQPTYIYAYTQETGNPLKQVVIASGSVVKSFTTGGMAGGADAGGTGSYLYLVGQDPTRFCWVYDGEISGSGVAPKSLGIIRAIFR